MTTRPAPATSILVLIDVQERLLGAFPEATRSRLLPRLGLLLTAARALSMPMVVTEQYPQGLGPTLPELRAAAAPDCPTLAKTAFSCFGAAGFVPALAASRRDAAMAPPAPAASLEALAESGVSLILCGVETHVCVLQTALDALGAGISRVIVPADAVASRHDEDHRLALALMDREGAWITSAESLAFMLLGDARHPAFKAVSAQVRALP